MNELRYITGTFTINYTDVNFFFHTVNTCNYSPYVFILGVTTINLTFDLRIAKICTKVNSLVEYSTLLNFTSFIWVCTGYSNYSHRTPSLNPILSCTNSYSILTNCSDDNNDLPNNHFFTSTPSKDKTNINKTPPIFSSKVKKVNIMIMNCNGVKGPSKQAAFLATLDIHRPDIVLGCESKLCNSMCSYEFFPKNYTVFRKDRNVIGDGVFVATSHRIISY